MKEPEESELLGMTVEIVSSYVANNVLQAGALPELIKTVHATIVGLTLGGGGAEGKA